MCVITVPNLLIKLLEKVYSFVCSHAMEIFCFILE